MIKLIVAIANNNVIGFGNKMPWHSKEEFKYFKKVTMGSSLLFGRTTYLGIQNTLPGRNIFVLSPIDIKGVETIHNTNEALKLFDKFKTNEQTLFIAGGKSVYEEFYNYADELIISKMHKAYKGDVTLELDLSNWNKELIKSSNDFNVFKYTKK